MSSQWESSRSTIAATFHWKHCGITAGLCCGGDGIFPVNKGINFQRILGISSSYHTIEDLFINTYVHQVTKKPT